MHFRPPYRANVLTDNKWIPINIQSDKELKIFKHVMKHETYVITCTHEELYLTND